MPLENKKNIIISAGGTGGHIIPAITIGISLENANVTFTCGKRGIEKRIYESFNVTPVLFDFNSFSAISYILKLPKNLLKSFKLLLSKNPDSVIITGNYTSVPIGIVSIILQKKIFTIEQDSLIGKANKLFARFAYRIFTAYKGPFKYIDNKKAVYIGHIIRDEVRNPMKRENDINIKTDRKKVLVIGGSQGALTMTKKIIKILSNHKNYHLIIIAGNNFEMFENSENVTILPFYRNIGYLYSISDIIIARSGALSVAEISSTNKPALFVPLKNSSNDEQKKNAMIFMKKNPQFEIINENELCEENLIKKIKKIENLRGNNNNIDSKFFNQIKIIKNYV